MISWKWQIPVMALMLFTACSKQETPNLPTGEVVALSVTTPHINESDQNTEITRSGSALPATQTVTVPIDNSNMMLEAALEPVKTATTRANTALATGVKYRIIAFENGNVTTAGYISYADYKVGTTEPVAGELLVPTGVTITFVCYSLNTTSLPAFDENTLDIAANPLTNDLLYTQFNQEITSENKTLSFSFGHKFSQVTVIADATGMALNITAISATLAPNYAVTMAVADGTLTAGTSTARTIPWGTVTEGQTVTSSACNVFTNGSNTITVSIPSVTIQGVTKNNLTATFSSNSMQSGYKYTLRLKFSRTVEGISVAGLTWAPGNLIYTGGTYSFAATQEYYTGKWNGGDYWNWCQLDPTNYSQSGSSYSLPIDPCQQVAPTGIWRMPTRTELKALISSGSVWTTKNGVNGRYFGTTSATAANAAPNSYIFLPAAGIRNLGSTGMSNVSGRGYYWSSTYGVYSLWMSNTGINADSADSPKYGMTIRCVK